MLHSFLTSAPGNRLSAQPAYPLRSRIGRSQSCSDGEAKSRISCLSDRAATGSTWPAVRLHKTAPRGALPQSSQRHGPDCTSATVTGHRRRPDLPHPPGHQQHFLLDIRLPSRYYQCRGSHHRRERPLGGCGLLGLRGPGGRRPVRFVAGLERTNTSAGMLQWAAFFL